MAVGAALSEARRAHGRSVEELSATTRIRPHLIRAIEDEEFAACGGDVYARGHVRALAKALDVDPSLLLAELAATGGAPPAPLRAPAADPGLVLREHRFARGWLTAAGVLLGVLVALAALRLVLPGDRAGSDPGAPSRAANAPPTAATSPTPTMSKPSTPPPVVGSGSLAVSFTVTGTRCWISVKDSAGTTQLANTLSTGQTATFRDDRKLSIVVGDVTAVGVTVNGQEVTLQGARGGVKRFVVHASDPLAAFGDGGAAGGNSSPGA